MQGSKGFWAEMREAFERGRAGQPPWRNSHGAAEVNEFLHKAKLNGAEHMMRGAYAAAKGRRETFGSRASKGRRDAGDDRDGVVSGSAYEEGIASVVR
jgi:hypothetical protein